MWSEKINSNDSDSLVCTSRPRAEGKLLQGAEKVPTKNYKNSHRWCFFLCMSPDSSIHPFLTWPQGKIIDVSNMNASDNQLDLLLIWQTSWTYLPPQQTYDFNRELSRSFHLKACIIRSMLFYGYKRKTGDPPDCTLSDPFWVLARAYGMWQDSYRRHL